MNTGEFLEYLQGLKIKLTVHGTQLKCGAMPGVLTPTLRAELSRRKSEIIDFLHIASGERSSIQPIPRDRPLPLSYAQQRLWFLDQLEGPSATYNIARAYQLSGRLNGHALEQAITALIRRHESLRTTFPIHDGEPIQVISPDAEIPLSVVNLQSDTEEDRSIEVLRLAHEAAHQPFDLSCDRLIRVTLFRLSSDSHVLLVTLHHIVSDGWSMGIFFQELSTLYRTCSQGQTPSLPQLPIQYADFAHWQRQRLQDGEYKQHLNYWRQQLAGAPTRLDLPTDYPRPPIQRFRGQVAPFQLDADLSHPIKVLSQQSKTTLFITLLATFSVLLFRLSQSEDIVIGSPIANRSRQDMGALIGCFANTLPLRMNLQGNPSFSTLLQRIHQMALDAYTHQAYPFEKLVEDLQPERHLSYHPLFQVMFVLQNIPVGQLSFPNITLTAVPLDRVSSTFDLTLSMRETAEGLTGSWEFNSDLFQIETIQRFHGHFQTLLAAIIAEPDQRIAELPLLTAAERRQLLEWTPTRTLFPQNACIHQLVEQQVERTPDAIAVIAGDQQLTYQQLHHRAQRLADRLQTLGVGPEVLVGLCVERSLEMAVGLLAILKAGGAYLPLDWTQPPDRMDHILTNAQLSLVLTTSALAPSLTTGNIRTLLLEDLGSGPLQSHPLLPPVTPSQLAYVIYTSGSTGQPKGVMVPHQAAVNFIFAAMRQYQLTGDDRVLQFASLSFDAALEEIFPCWASGGTLVLRSELSSIPHFLHHCQVLKLTVVSLPTAFWHQWVAALTTDPTLTPPPSLRLVIIGGEAAPAQVLQTWQRMIGPSPRLLNTYGPTEATVVTTLCDLSNLASQTIPLSPSLTAVPIGTPIVNVQTYILDAHQQPVPSGVQGELYIGGAGLARGYLNRPALTAEKFVPNPFATPGSRLYKTGDRARRRPDGNLEFLGRLDGQVKVRGFRVELGEVEAALLAHPQVKSVVVHPWKDQGGQTMLVAYLISPQPPPTELDLRQFVTQKLPSYMHPQHYQWLDAFPVSTNGKVDRQALPPLDLSSRSLAPWTAPRDHLERQLLEIWQEVLQTSSIGVQDNFFHVGGHSLLATSLMTQIQQRLGMNFPLTLLFQHPTLAQLASALRQFSPELPKPSGVVPLHAGSSEQSPLFLIHPIGGGLGCYTDLTRRLGRHYSLYGLQAQGLYDRQPPHSSISAMAAHYVQCIRSVQPAGPYALGGWSFGGVVALEMAHQLGRQGHPVASLTLIDSWVPRASQPPETFAQRLSAFVTSLEFPPPDGIAAGERWCDQSPAAALEGLLTQLQQAHRLPLDWTRSQFIQLFEVFQANDNALDRYQPPVYTGPTTALSCEAASPSPCPDLAVPLSQFVSGSLTRYVVPGNHFTMLREPHVAILVERIVASLEKGLTPKGFA